MIGLSIAWELNRRDWQTTVVDSNPFGTKASWAGAGILAPANFETMTQPLDRLKGYGSLLHVESAAQLKSLTGIDNGYRNCGGLYLARTAGERAALMGQLDEWQQYGIEFRELEPGSLDLPTDQQPLLTVRVPGEGQIDNRSHLQALCRACELTGSEMIANCGPLDFKTGGNHCLALVAGQHEIDFDHLCLCTGAWSTSLVEQFGVNLPVTPVRGQMALYKFCLLYTSPSPRDQRGSRMPSSA